MRLRIQGRRQDTESCRAVNGWFVSARLSPYDLGVFSGRGADRQGGSAPSQRLRLPWQVAEGRGRRREAEASADRLTEIRRSSFSGRWERSLRSAKLPLAIPHRYGYVHPASFRKVVSCTEEDRWVVATLLGFPRNGLFNRRSSPPLSGCFRDTTHLLRSKVGWYGRNST